MIFKLNLTKIKPYAILGTFAVVLLISGLISLIVIRYRPPSKIPSQPSPIPSSYATSKPSPNGFTHPSGFEKEFGIIKPLLPYNGQGFTIKHILPANIILISIDAKNRQEFIQNRQKVEAFLKSKGIDNLCALDITWIPSQPQQFPPKTLSPSDLNTTNCQVVF